MLCLGRTQVVADLWGDDRLLSSFESINVTPPAPAAGGAPLPGGSWLHTDQSPSRRGVACIQGLVNMVDVGPRAGTGAPCGHPCGYPWDYPCGYPCCTSM